MASLNVLGRQSIYQGAYRDINNRRRGHGVATAGAVVDPCCPFATALEQRLGSRGRVRCPGWHMVHLASGPSKRLHQSTKPPGGAVEPLARIDYFDFDDPAFAAAYGINGVHADRAIIDKP